MGMIIFFLLLFLPYSFTQSFKAHGPIQNVIRYNDKIFVGASNALYSLSSNDLSVISSSITGPVYDSPFCSIDGSSCLRGHSKIQTDNYNKILEVLPSGLLSCGSIHQGSCTLHSLSDLSSTIQSFPIAVAANDHNASTSWLSVPSGLVVSSSHTVDSPYREVPTIAYRTLDDLQVLNAGSLEGESAVFVRAEYRPLFPQTFISSFKYDNFVYVTIVQPSNARRLPPSAPLITKLARFCIGDERFTSYSEIELQCRGEDNSNLNILTNMHIRGDKLIAAFTSSTTGQSAVCVYSMPRIKVTFWYNIDRCRGGGDSIGLPHIGRDTRCLNRSHLPLEENTCELGVGGKIEASEMSLFSISSPIRSITSKNGPDVVFMGTDDGKIIKLRAKESGALLEYSTVSGEGEGPISSLIFMDEDRLLVHQRDALRILPVADCGKHEECSSCLLSTDPLCGWCPSSSSCTSSCTHDYIQKCPVLRGPPSPSFLPVGITANITIPIEHLPVPNGFSYECVFDSSLVSSASFSSSSITCPSPSMPKTKTTSTVSLSLRTSSSHRSIATHNFTFYDCGQYSTCSSCVSSHWKCSWCGNSCTLGQECLKPSSQCVQIAPSQLLMIPSRRSSNLSFRVENSDQLVHSSHSCMIRVGVKKVRVRAEISSDTVICRGIRVDGRVANVSYEMQLINDDKEEVIDETQVTIYDCSLLASDCSSCLTSASFFGCSWCAGRCASDCPSVIANSDPDLICNAPTILSFHPSSAPLEGGTLLTVVGRDLGSVRSDIEGRIMVSGSRCHLRHFTVSTGFTCLLEKGSGSGPVRVAIGHSARRTAESSRVFSFHSIEVSSMSPPFGPLSGGTKINIYGRHLNAGTDVQVTIGDLPCIVRQRNSSSSLTCVTSPSPKTQNVGPLKLRIDNATREVKSLAFEYRPDPIIHSIFPLSAFRSGGRLLTIQGSNLDSVLSSRLFIHSSHEDPSELLSDLSPCKIENATLMQCLSPALASSDQPPSTVSSWSLGLQMDGVTSLHRLPRQLSLSIVPDPHFEPFNGIRTHLSGQSLILHGNHLNLAADPEEYEIWIGSDRCLVTVIDSKQLVCTPPSIQPEPRDEKGEKIEGELPPVTVSIGRLRYELGLIEYSNGGISRRVILVIGVIIASLIFFFIILLLLWRRKSEQREKDYKKIQIQMENLESNVRKECKQAFAELQTTLEENSTEEESGVYVLPKDEFVSRLLWIDGPPHPSTTIYSTSQPVTLAQLDSLLCSIDFIRCFIITADSDPSSSPQEKSLLSSLLISALASNFDYLTQVVLSLLKEHITSTVQHRSPTLVFRQSESLVELLFQKWFAICMYDFVADRGAPQLQILHTAFKLQSDRGPVDCVTGAARYTINESKLLRETIDSTPIDILISSPEGHGPIPVRVLACDSISQMKRKAIDAIYRHLPSSGRPHLSHVVLEWQRPDGDCYTLRDTDEGDSTGRRGGSKQPKKIQTVNSYALTNGSHVLVIPARRTPSSGADSGQSSWSSLDCSSLSTSSYYHLVPPSKNNNGGRTRFSDSIPQSIPEVYLTRLLTSKGTVQKFIDDLLESILLVDQPILPPALKIVCDLLDDVANQNKISDPLLVHQWKANCLVLRFWVQLISNARLIIDVDPCVAVDANLSIIGQTLMASCSSGEPLLHADSPSSRLLFAREISRLRPLSSDLFNRIRRSPPPQPNWPSTLIPVDQPSRSLPLGELLSWVRGNGVRLVNLLDQRTDSSLRLSTKLSHLLNLSIEPEHIYATLN